MALSAGFAYNCPMSQASTIGDVLRFLIERGPGRTEAELARAIFGAYGFQQRVNEDCGLLDAAKLVDRRGSGGVGDPYRYYPTVQPDG